MQTHNYKADRIRLENLLNARLNTNRKATTMKQARDILIDIKLDMMNNYLSVERYAECNGLTDMEACKLLDLANAVFSHDHPEA